MKRRILAAFLTLALGFTYSASASAYEAAYEGGLIEIEDDSPGIELMDESASEEIVLTEESDSDLSDTEYIYLDEDAEEFTASSDSDEIIAPFGGMEIENPVEVDDPFFDADATLEYGEFETTGPSATDPVYVPENLPDLRKQSPYGTCWAHAAIANAEISLIRQGIVTKDVDLSELHLAYFTYNSVPDPIGGISDDENSAIVASGSTLLDRGCTAEFANAVLSSWVGAADEDTANYTTMAATANKSGLDASIAYQDVAHLSHYFETNLNVSNKNNVKKLIADYGSVVISFEAINSQKTAISKGIYNSANNCYYNDVSASTNHEVNIVGWDDNFPKENFSITPPGDGAWLIRNSWTAGSFDKHQEYYGYFWMSYYEATLGRKAFAVVYDDSYKYDNNYQYDGAMYTVTVSGYSAASNIFEVKGPATKESLEAVSFYTSGANVDYTVKIYVDPKEGGTPDTGTLMPECTTKGKTTFAGYYTVPLNNSIILEQGQRFAAVVELSASGKNSYFGAEQTVKGTWYKTYASAKEGQSFVKSGSNWLDFKPIGGKSNRGNLKIKAFTRNLFSAAAPVMQPVIVSFDPGEGTVSEIEISVFPYAEYGELPVPERPGYTFAGWFTEKEGGIQVTSHMTVGGEDHILYAHWDEIIEVKPGPEPIPVPEPEIEPDPDPEPVPLPEPVPDPKPEPGIVIIDILNNERCDYTSLTGNTRTLRVSYDTGKTYDGRVSWSSDNSAVATVDATGVVTSKNPGVANITAVTEDGAYKAIATINVEQAVESVTLDEDTLDLGIGEMVKVHATVTPSEAKQKLLWTTTNSKVAAVDLNGVILGVSKGTATIKAVSTDGSGRYASVVVNVGNLVDKVEINDNGVGYVAAGKTLKLNAVINNNDPDRVPVNKCAEWSLEPGTGYATISTDGTLTGVKEGTVKVTLSAYNGLSDTKEYMVYVPVKKAALMQSTVVITPGSTYALKVNIVPTVTNANETGQATLASPVKWSIADSYKQYLTVDEDTGVITAGTLLKNSIPVTATFTPYAGARKTLTCKVSIKNQAFESFSLSQSSINLIGGKQATINTKFTPAVPAEGGVDWSIVSGADAISIIDSTDSYITIAALPASSAKEAVILARAKANSAVTATCTVNILSKAETIRLTKDSEDVTGRKFDMAKGTSKALKAEVLAPDMKTLAANQKVTYKVDNTAVATISTSGKISAKKNGEAHITVISAENGDAVATCTVKVVTLSLDKTCANIGLKEGHDTVVIKPLGVTEDTMITWSINTPAKVSATLVNGDDVRTDLTGNGSYSLSLKGVSSGKIKVTATVTGTSKKATCVVSIFSHVIGLRLTNMGEEIEGEGYNYVKELKKGKTTTIKAVPAYYEYTSKTYVFSSQVAFRSSNPSIATVSDSGKITAKSPGTCYITACTVDGGIEKVVKVTVP